MKRLLQIFLSHRHELGIFEKLSEKDPRNIIEAKKNLIPNI
jgi:hypothetical protein